MVTSSIVSQVPLSWLVGLAPEVSWVGPGGGLQAVANATFNILRPEAVESLYMLWRVTGDARFRDMGWRIFEAFTAAARARPIKIYHSCRLCSRVLCILERVMRRALPRHGMAHL